MTYWDKQVIRYITNILTVGLLLCVPAKSAFPQIITALTPEQQSQAMRHQHLALNVIINGQPTRWISDFIQQDSNLWASLDDLDHIGIRTDDLQPDPSGNLIALSQISGLRYHYFAATQEIAFQIEDARLIPNQIGGNARIGLSSITPGTGFLINYDAYLQHNQQNSDTSLALFSEERFFHNNSYLSNTGLHNYTQDNNDYIRLDTTWTYSAPQSLKEVNTGDIISGSLSWSRSVRLGGVKISRNFSLRPDLITFPVPNFTGSATVPSSVELYVNNIRQYSGEVPSGPFVLNNTPSISGAGEATIVVRDQLGRDVVTTIPLYIDSRLLQKGLLDYSAEIGFMRQNYGSRSFKYDGNLAASASARYGYSDHITLEGHAEGISGVYMAGAGALARLGLYGVVNTAIATSGGGGSSGQMLVLGYQRNTSKYVIDLQAKRTFGEFKDLSTVDGTLFPQEFYQATLAIPIKQNNSLSISFIHQKDDYELSRIGAIGFNAQLPRGMSLNFNAYKDFEHTKTHGISVSLSIPLGRSISSSFTASSDSGKTSYTASATRTTPYEGGWGWDIQAQRSHHTNSGLGRITYLGQYGEVSAAIRQQGHDTSTSLQATGSIVAMDGALLPARRMHQSFALISTNDTAGIPILYENRIIGTTNKRGHYLIPDLVAYNVNKVEINPLVLDANIRTSAPVQWVVPGRQAGALVNFEVEKFRGGQAILLGQDNQPLPPGTLVVLLETSAKTIVGYDGMIFFDTWEEHNTIAANLPQQGWCQVTVNYPKNINGSIPMLGTFTCKKKDSI